MICARAVFALLLVPALVSAELQPLEDTTLSQLSGQGGVYLSGEFSINKDGGALWGTPANNNPAQWTASQRSCASGGSGAAAEACGMRLAIRSEANGGWYVLDNLKGIFSFEGLTLRTRTINSGFNGDGVGFNQDVLEFGLPSELRYKQGSFAFGVANQGGWRNNASSAANGGDPSYQQTNIYSAKIDGSIRMQGNVLVFPKN
ncbi:hypothetical protein D3880_04590 [Pseudomonas cavernae]|uniref:DUF6160 domain-containing protein n=1 Tax=Pseudomonas cavernae TaxID=2320867 RepID=A0A385YXP1_9PSED|nr:DUF6160 family protein [Pseudomonas cavernae]AYC31709.1 hypothetical protein D3880_04590 [Pseudomonas cavernae]